MARQDLTASDLARIFSFEGTIGVSGDWRPSGAAVASATDRKADGSHSMAISGTASVSVVSTALTSVGPVGASLGLEVWLPSALAGQSYKGVVQAFFNSPTLSLFSDDTVSVQLSSLTPGQFSHVTIPIDAAVAQKLSQTNYTDLTITLAFNLANTTGKTYVDKLAFAAPITGTGGAATGGAASIGGNATGGTPLGGTTNLGGVGGTVPTTVGGAALLGGSAGIGGTTANPIGGSSATALTGGAPGGSTMAAGGGSTASGSTGTSGGTSGSSGSAGTSSTPYVFSFQLPPGVHRNQLALATTAGDLFVGDRVRLVSGSGYASISAVSGGKVNRIGVSCQVQDVFSDGDVMVSNNAEVHGEVETTGVVSTQTGAKLDGEVSEHFNLAPLQTISWTVNFPNIAAPALNLSGSQNYAPGSYPAIDIQNGAQLTLVAGTYTFNSMTVEPGATLRIDNSAGPVFVYLRDGFTFRGTVSEVKSQGNVLFGVAGTNPVVIDQSFKGIVVAPSASLSLATTTQGHQGAFFAKSITALPNTTITLVPFEPSNFCSAGDPCTSFCGCATASNPCGADLNCSSGLACGDANGAAFGYPDATNVCWGSSCGTSSQHSADCARYPKGCRADSECQTGQVCGTANGDRFQYMATRVCWPAACTTDPVTTGCGSIFSVCGTCPSTCVPSCAGKTCGDSNGDGCGGICTGYCSDGGTGCRADTECKTGSVCSPDAAPYYGQTGGQTTCWSVECQRRTPAERSCGTATSACGPVCPDASTACSGRQCGPDPLTGKSCGTCSAGQWCSTGGLCVARSIPTGPNVPLDIATPTDVGAIPGSLEINQRGEAQYTVPLQVPPGVNGLTPKLSLEYRSTLREGEVGVGWSIGGLSSIARCPTVFADGGPKPVDYTENDTKYCLDGIPLLKISPDGIWDKSEYRTEFDSLVRIIRHYDREPSSTDKLSGPSYFEVRTPDGRTSTYGGGNATGNYGSIVASPDGSHGDWVGARRIWALSKTQDPQGNTVEYTYDLQVDGADYPNGAAPPGHALPPRAIAQASHPQLVEITYGGNATIPSNRKIVLTRERLGDDSAKSDAIRFGWTAGAPFSLGSRITTIAMTYEDQSLREYRLQYASGTRSQLIKLFECSLGHCKQPTGFAYNDLTIFMLPNDSSISDVLAGHALDEIQAILDADADGLVDLVLNSNLNPNNPIKCDGTFLFAHANGTTSHPYDISNMPSRYDTCSPSVVGDFDNSGTEAVRLARRGDDCAKWYLNCSQVPYTIGITDDLRLADATSSTTAWTLAGSGSPTYYWRPYADYNGDGKVEQKPFLNLVDIDTNGDGVADLVDSRPGQNSEARWLMRNDSPTYSQDGPWAFLGVRRPAATPSPQDVDSFIRTHLAEPADPECFSINSKGDIQKEYTGYFAVCRPTREFILENWINNIKILDANGDGLKDILTWDVGEASTYGPSLNLSVWYNTGRDGFVGVGVSHRLSNADRSTLNSFLNSGVFGQGFVLDVDRDGTDEFIMIDTVNRDVYALRTGPDYQSFRVDLIQPHGSPLSIPHWFTDKSRVVMFDVDGNGVPDIVFGEGPKTAVAYQAMPEYGLLQSVTDGNGRTDTLAYVAGKALGHHAAGDQVHFQDSKPAVVIPPTVVTRTTTAPGEGIRTETYGYTDGRLGYYGRGFLGYTEVDKQVKVKNFATDPTTPVTDERTYYHPDSRVETIESAAAQTHEMYFEAGRPWKRRTVTQGLSTGLGSTQRTIAQAVTETHELRGMLSDARVPMWMPYSDTITVSELGTTETTIAKITKTYNFDQWAQLLSVTYAQEGPDGFTQESDMTTFEYKRSQDVLDRWLLQLWETKKTYLSNSLEHFSRTEKRDYNEDGSVHGVTANPEDGDLSVAVQFQYNDRGNVTSVVESSGDVSRETDAFYDSAGDLVQYKLNPLLHSTSFAYYRGYGQLAGVRDPNGLVDSRRIDGFGRQIQHTDTKGVIAETSYETPGSEASFLTTEGREVVAAVRTNGAGQATVVSFYDHYGRYIGDTYKDNDGVTRHSQVYYDVLGNRIAGSHLPFADDGASEHLDQVHFDNLHRPDSAATASDVGLNDQAPVKIQYGHPSTVAGVPAEIVFYAAVTAVRATFPNGTAVTKVLDAHGRTVAMVDRNGAVFTFEYSPRGQLRFFRDAAGQTVENQYDLYGRIVYTSDPTRGVSTATYSALGDTVIRTTPTGDVTQHFDLLGRPLTETAPEGTTVWSYDSEPGAIGRLIEVAGPPTASAPLGHKVHYSYGTSTDADGVRGSLRNITSTIANETFAYDFDYDALGRVKTIQYPAVGGTRYAVTQYYSFGGRLDRIREGTTLDGRSLWEMTGIDGIGRGTSERALDAMTTKFSYTDVEGLIKQLTTSEAGADKLQLDYDYDIEDNVTSVTRRENGTLSTNSRFYEYDTSGRLVGEYGALVGTTSVAQGTAIGNVAYSANGNIDSKLDVGVYTYGMLGNPYAVTAAGANTYSYDTSGRQISRTGPDVATGHMDLTWTSFDSPSMVTLADGSSIRYEYDGLKNKVLEESSTKRKFLVGDLYQRVDDLVSGSRHHTMVVRAGNKRVAEVEFAETVGTIVSGPTATAVVADRMGSAVLTRAETGEYTFRNYSAFGKPSGTTVAPSGRAFADYVQDDDIGLSWMSNRLYDPILGRVLMPDPVISSRYGQDGANRYAYVHNRPTALIDPSGFDGEDVVEPQPGDTVIPPGEVITATPPQEPTSTAAGEVSGGSASNEWFAETTSGTETYTSTMWEGTGAASSFDASSNAPLEERGFSMASGTDASGLRALITSDTAAMSAPPGAMANGADWAVQQLRGLTAGDAQHQFFSQQSRAYTDIVGATTAYEVVLAGAFVAGALGMTLAAEGGAATLLTGLGIDQTAFASGSMVAFEQPGVVGFTQLQGSRLVAGIFSVNAPGQGLAILSQFRAQAIILGRALGATEVELAGAEFTNTALRAMLIRQGFVAGTMDAPAALGGGVMNVLSKVIGL